MSKAGVAAGICLKGIMARDSNSCAIVRGSHPDEAGQVEFRHLRYFLAVAEEGSFNRAAARLLVSQPSLSRQIRSLERQLGDDLFERTRTGAQLTAAGTALLGHARQLIALEVATRDVVSGMTKASEMVSVGIPPGTPSQRMLGIADMVKQEVASCALSYLEASSTEQLHMLHQGRLDIGIVHQAPPTQHQSRCLWEEPLGVAVRPQHRLAARKSYRLADLDGLRVLVHSRNQVPTQQDSLMATALAADIRPVWLFTQFVEHALACAEAAEADAVLLGNHNAAQHLPDWPWKPLEGLPLAMATWMVWPTEARTVVDAVANVITGHTLELFAAVQHDDVGPGSGR